MNTLFLFALVFQTINSESVPAAVAPLEILSCFNEMDEGKSLHGLRLSNATAYRCKFAWHGGTLSATAAIGVELSGFMSNELEFDYDKTKLKRLASNNATTVTKFLIENRATEGMWFTMRFRYNRCIGVDAEAVRVIVSPIGTRDWEPVVWSMDQSVRDCFRPTTNAPWWHFGAQATSGATPISVSIVSTTDRAPSFIFVLIVVGLIAFCLLCIYTVPEQLDRRRVVAV